MVLGPVFIHSVVEIIAGIETAAKEEALNKLKDMASTFLLLLQLQYKA